MKKKGEGSGFYTKDKEAPESGVVSDSMVNGGTGDLRLEIKAQDGRLSLKGQRPQPPSRAYSKPSTEHRTSSCFNGERCACVRGGGKW